MTLSNVGGLLPAAPACRALGPAAVARRRITLLSLADPMPMWYHAVAGPQMTLKLLSMCSGAYCQFWAGIEITLLGTELSVAFGQSVTEIETGFVEPAPSHTFASHS